MRDEGGGRRSPSLLPPPSLVDVLDRCPTLQPLAISKDACDSSERTRVDKEIGQRIAKAEAQIKSATASAMSKVSDIATDTAESIVNELVGAHTQGGHGRGTP